MSRSTEIPFAEDPLAEDPLLAELRDARPEPPDDLLDPHAPANAAILQAIVGPARPRRSRRRMVIRVAAVAAVAAAVAGLVIVWPFGAPEPTAADVVRNAAAASESALDSGRALVTVTHEVTSDGLSEDLWPELGDSGSEDTYEYRFAGEDVAVAIVLGGRDGEGYPGERRIVDGEMYWHAGPDPSSPWFHRADGGPARSDWTGDPRSLLATLEPRARFELVGDDIVDGVEVTHLRSRTPSVFSPDELGLGQAVGGGTPTGLDLWVDGDGVVRRVDLETTSSYDVNVAETPEDSGEVHTVTEVTTAVAHFTDIGVPNTVEAPATFCEVTDEMMADPPPPGTDVCSPPRSVRTRGGRSRRPRCG